MRLDNLINVAILGAVWNGTLWVNFLCYRISDQMFIIGDSISLCQHRCAASPSWRQQNGTGEIIHGIIAYFVKIITCSLYHIWGRICLQDETSMLARSGC